MSEKTTTPDEKMILPVGLYLRVLRTCEIALSRLADNVYSVPFGEAEGTRTDLSNVMVEQDISLMDSFLELIAVQGNDEITRWYREEFETCLTSTPEFRSLMVFDSNKGESDEESGGGESK